MNELVKIGAEKGPAAMDQIGWAIMKFVIIYKLIDIAADKFSKLVDPVCVWLGRRITQYLHPEILERTGTPALEANTRNDGNDEENDEKNDEENDDHDDDGPQTRPIRRRSQYRRRK